jgi:predicted signal transduction protein with EAL and GGDEF domain
MPPNPAGRRTYRFFEPDMDARVKARRKLEIDLRQAIADRALEVSVFKPTRSPVARRKALKPRRSSNCCALGCYEMQGYLFSPAKPSAEVRQLLNAHRQRPTEMSLPAMRKRRQIPGAAKA